MRISLFLFFYLFSFVAAYDAGDCVGVEPSVSGDWVINVSTSCSDSVIELDGDLVINNSFNLNFSNVTLIVNSSDLRGFYIYNNGSFYVDNSNLTSRNSGVDNNYWWINYKDSLLVLENSDVFGVGRGTGDNAGIEVQGNNSIIRENNISGGHVGIYLASFDSLIEGNSIVSSNASGGNVGIFLDDCASDVFANDIISDYGIYVYDDFGSNVSDNLIFSDYAITIVNANNSFLKNNSIRDVIGYTGVYGISITNSENILLDDFNISRYTYGVKIFSSEDVVVINSFIEKSGSGIYLSDSANNSFLNLVIANGSGEDLSFDFSSEVYCNNYFYNVENLDGKVVGYYNESVDISDEEFSQLTLCNADGSNLSNVTINSSQDLKTNGLNLLFSDNCVLEDISSVYNMRGLVLKYSDYNVVRDSVFDLNEYDGILNYYSDGNVFLNISADLNDFGISILRSENITINDSTLRENYAGLNGKYDLNIDYFNFSSDNPDHLCSHDINRVNGTNYKMGYYNSQVSISDETFSELIVCGSSGSVFSNITLYSSGGNLNNVLYLSDLLDFEMSDFSVDLFYGGMILHNVNDSNFSDGYVNYSQRNIFIYESYGNIFDNVSSYNSRLSGYVLDESFNNVVGNSWIVGNLQMGFLVYNNSADNLIFNNYVKNTINVFVSSSAGGNFWNTTLVLGTNIVGGGYTGGNFWTMVSGDGFSDSCSASSDGICDEEYEISSGNFDYLALVESSDITDCGYVINSGGEYYLSGNLSLGASDSSCINVSSDDVEINCNGFFINGNLNLGYGLFARNISGLDVRDCNFNLLGKESVFLVDVRESVFENVSSLYSDASGFMIANSSSNLFRGNNVSNSYNDGFTLVNSSFNSFIYNEVFNNSLAGFYLNDSHFNNISGGWILKNGAEGECGMTIINSENNFIFKNVFNNSNNVNVSSAVYSDNVWSFGYGNYWGSPAGDGFSDVCVDADLNGVCDGVYDFSVGGVTAIDYLPVFNISILARTLNINMNYSYWESGTTNFSGFDDADLASLGSVRFFHRNGKILLRGNLVILRDLDLDGNILVSSNRIYINSTALPEFNQAAQLTLYNISYNVPLILRDGIFCSSCDFVSYLNNELVFNVSGFSEYSSKEGSCEDGVQNYGEEGVDCGGICSDCDVSDGGGGGGGGGGSSSVDIVENVSEVNNSNVTTVDGCVEDVVCGNWSECIDGFENRTCEDVSRCVEAYVEERECELEGEGWKWEFYLAGFFVIVLLSRWIYFKLRYRIGSFRVM